MIIESGASELAVADIGLFKTIIDVDKVKV